jgi:4-phytase / acid phosphatase
MKVTRSAWKRWRENNRSARMRNAVFAAIAFAAVSVSMAAHAEATLKRVVIVERHGVRSPTKAAEDLAKYSDAAWPSWPVAPGELTPHGAAGLTRMGEGLRQHYAALGLLPRSGCATSIFIWSDGADSRTRASGEAVARGLNPDCATVVKHGPEGAADPIFDAQEAGVCKADPALARKSVAPRLAAILARNGAAYARARARLQLILTPGGNCREPGSKQCTVAAGENALTAKKDELRLEGPLATGSTLSENLLLEYAQGMAPGDVGWGRADAAAIAAIMPLHNLYADAVRRDPYLAARRGSTLLRTVLDALDGKPGSFAGAVAVPGDANFVLLLGHDGNLSNLSGLLGVSWTLPGQPDATAPDTALAFEVWREPDGTRTVALKVYYQTLEELRALTSFTPKRPVRAVTLPVPGCQSGRACRAEGLKTQLLPVLAQDCLKPGQAR